MRKNQIIQRVRVAKRHALWFVVFAAALWAIGPAYGEEPSPPRLLIVGDSLSDAYNLPREAGWVALLAQRLDGEVEVVNAAISGETSAGGLQRLPSLLAQFQPRWLLIILGGNDGLRALPPAQLQSNLADMVALAHADSVAVALMQVRMPANLGPQYQQRFEAVYPAVAKAQGATLLPFFLQSIFDQPGMLMDDGIHPTAAAQPLMLEAVWEDLQSFMQSGQSAPTGVSLNDE